MATFRAFLSLRPCVLLLLFAASASSQEGPLPNEMPEKAARILNNAEEWDLYSLQPSPSNEVADKTSFFYPHQVLGRLTVKKTDDVGKKVLDAFEKTIGKGDWQARCFEPEHAIHAEDRDDSIDIIICFHCGWAYVYVNEKEVAALIAEMSGDEMFDSILKNANIPLAQSKSDADK